MISIIIPTYNSARTLKRCLDSILEQTFTDLEVLLMDGVSKDDTLSIAYSYNDSRIRIYSEPDKGIYDAMNKGILKAKGEWLYFLGSDDYLNDRMVLSKISKYLHYNVDIVYGEVNCPELNDVYKGAWTFENVWANRCHQAIFYRQTVFSKIGVYNCKYEVWADWDLNHRWYCCPAIKHQYVNIQIAHYSSNGFSASRVDKKYKKVMIYNLLIYGNHVFTISQRRKLAAMAIKEFSRIDIRYYVVLGYKIYLRILSLLKRQ